MKLNLVWAVKFLETASMLKIFIRIIVIPMFIGMIITYFMQHQGTSFKVTDEVEIDISIDGEEKGTFKIGLFGEHVPKTTANFKAFATDGVEGYKYVGTTFHRAVKDFVVQGGDVMWPTNQHRQKGEGRLSLYGDMFPDESFEVMHAAPGYVGMANSGPDTNGCQFYICASAPSYLDHKHVVFGKVVENMDLVREMTSVEVDSNNTPLKDVLITGSRAYKLKSTYFISNDPYNIYDWATMMMKPILLCFVMVSLFTYLMNYIDRGIALEDAVEKLREKARARMVEEDKKEAEAAGARRRVTGEGEARPSISPELKEEITKRKIN